MTTLTFASAVLLGMAVGIIYMHHTTIGRLKVELQAERFERRLYTNLWAQAMKSVRRHE